MWARDVCLAIAGYTRIRGGEVVVSIYTARLSHTPLKFVAST